MRVACLLVPDLPLQAQLRADPGLAGRPLAITSGPGTRAEILAASREATDRGVRPGLTLPQARAVCPAIEVRVASPVLEQTARETLLDVALSLAPRAELAERATGPFLSEGVVFVDATGVEALHGRRGRVRDEGRRTRRTEGVQTNEGDPGAEGGRGGRTRADGAHADDDDTAAAEARFVSVLHARAEGAGLRGFVALASSRGVARLAARHLALAARLSTGRGDGAPAEAAATTRRLPPARELDFLGPLPVDLLDPDDRTAEALTRFGIQRVRDLLRLPRRDLAARVGPDLLALVARARGEETEPPLPEPREAALEEGEDLEAPVAQLEPLLFVLRGLVARAVERLALRGLGAAELRLALALEGGGRPERRIGLASPSQDAAVMLRALRLTLERDPPNAPVEGMRVRIEGVALRREQLDLFLPRGPSPSALDETLAELGSICGMDRVGAPEVVDDHRPGAFALKPFRRRLPGKRPDPGRRERPKRTGKSGRPHAADRPRSPRPPPPPPPSRGLRLTLRAVRPPVPAEVRLVDGRPARLLSAISRGEVLTAAGPWRTTGHWWSESAHFAVDHYDVQMSDGTVLRLAFDWRARCWQIDGLYD